MNSSDNWPKRKTTFWVASGLAMEEEPRQVIMLLYCLREEADDVLTYTSITADDRKKCSAIITKFNTFLQFRNNVTVYPKTPVCLEMIFLSWFVS